MITFLLGASAVIAVGVIVWLVKTEKQVRRHEKQVDHLWLEIQNRCDSIERNLDDVIKEINHNVDENYKYTDSRLDKLFNHIERDYVTKKNNINNKTDNTIDYNN